jgi:hypothetical protein
MSIFFAKRPARGGRSMVRLRPDIEGRIVLSTFRIKTGPDTVAANLKAGQDLSGHISLPSAILTTDAHGSGPGARSRPAPATTSRSSTVACRCATSPRRLKPPSVAKTPFCPTQI